MNTPYKELAQRAAGLDNVNARLRQTIAEQRDKLADRIEQVANLSARVRELEKEVETLRRADAAEAHAADVITKLHFDVDRLFRLATKKADAATITHGTLVAYKRHRCRCEPAWLASNAARKAARHKKRTA